MSVRSVPDPMAGPGLVMSRCSMASSGPSSRSRTIERFRPSPGSTSRLTTQLFAGSPSSGSEAHIRPIRNRPISGLETGALESQT